ncbi:hypothetical protein [uncultured Tateyamaria sp.]|uniref:hypothetical protein n=1 Tax=Tateyamaria sp. 1078 TaxID=3417464 RepID=UPI00260E3F6C|nr:hypothetical protein [uncultured Tateyamaria sp.]
MGIDRVFDALSHVSSPPPGAVNVGFGAAVEGPGGRWVPCASVVGNGVYLPCVYEVGPGRRQVCGSEWPSHSQDDAMSRAVELAVTAAA